MLTDKEIIMSIISIPNHCVFLFRKFSNQPYQPDSHWTTTRQFQLDPLYQHTAKQYADDPQFEKQQHEFVLDTTFGGSGRD